MGAHGSRLSDQQRQDQAELMMQQNVDIAKRLSKQHAANKKKPAFMIHQIGKDILGKMKFKSNENDNNKKKLIEIEGVTYEIVSFISEGGFGEVYKARSRRRDIMVAIKIMKNLREIREEIQNEINFLRLIKKAPIENHPVITYYGSQLTKENIHIAMELATCDLVKFWSDHMVNLDPENKFLLGITIIVYVLRALAFLEKLNIIHGDIKPQNLVIVPDNEVFYVKLIDFGTVEKMDTCRAQITVDASKAYTIFFASPEFLKRDSNHVITRHLHKKSDAWAAGVMFYILFFERLPWKDQFEYENFCNDPSARDVYVPKKGGYKAIIELLLKKNPEERSSANATLKQMMAHPALHDIIESLNENFCPVDDVCKMKVPDDIRKDLTRLARPGHIASASHSSFSRTLSGSRRLCRYGRDCYKQDRDHRDEFAHPGDRDYHVAGASNDQFSKPNCRYGSACYRKDSEHREKYVHPSHSDDDEMNSRGHSSRTSCKFGLDCFNTDPSHRRQYSHPNDPKLFANGSNHHNQSKMSDCQYGEKCYNHDPSHRSRFFHPGDSKRFQCEKKKCFYDDSCTKTKDLEHMERFQH